MHIDHLPRLPKIELHLHLDCSLSYQVVRQLDPTVTFDSYRQQFVGGTDCCSLVDYLAKAERGFALMQDAQSLRLVTLDLLEQLRSDGVIYAEIRFAPLLHLRQGLTPTQVVNIVDEALDEGCRQTGVEASLILCTLRHFNYDQSMTTAELTKPKGQTRVAGFDIAGDEAGYSLDAHDDSFGYAHQHGIACTAHAGEASGANSVWEVMQRLQPQRIGHGIRSAEDETLVKHLVEKQIHLEVCPSSNLCTCIYPDLGSHPIDRLYRKGLSLNINTDGRTISDTTLTREFEKVSRQFGWQMDDFYRTQLLAVEAAFLSPARKAQLRALLQQGYGALQHA